MVRWLVLLLTVCGCSQVFGLEDPVLAGQRWTAVATGNGFTCAIIADQSLWCVGSNLYGTIGTGNADVQVATRERVGTARWRVISATNNHACGIQSNASLWCWGRNVRGELGNGNQLDAQQPIQVAGEWTTVSTGSEHTCAIRADGTLWCWGANSVGQLGIGAGPDQSSPRMVGEMAWATVAAGIGHTCAIDSDGSLWCWGEGVSGQLGNGGMTNQASPVRVGSERWVEVDAGGHFTCGRTVDEQVKCWGNNFAGKLGIGGLGAGYPNPTPIVPIGRVEQIDLGFNNACARTDDGVVWCWGDNSRGAASLDVLVPLTSPTPVQDAPVGVRALDVGFTHACLIGADGSLWCAGADGWGQLGNGGSSTRVPRQVMGSWNKVFAHGAMTCTLDTNNHPHCAGDSSNGTFDGVVAETRRSLVTVRQEPWRTIAPGTYHACGLAMNGDRWCWGFNGYGGYGNGSTSSSPAEPVLIGSSSDTELVASLHVCAIGQGNMRASCWGRNESGQLGLGHTNTVTTPNDLIGVYGYWIALAVGLAHTCIVDGNVSKCAGDNTYGQLGDGTTTSSTMLRTVMRPPGVDFDAQRAGGHHTCALDNDDLAWCWGANGSGALGTGDRMNRNIPTLVAGSATWRELATGRDHTCGIHTDGSLWCWGANTRGQLGDGSADDHVIPTRVGTNTDWGSVAAGDEHTCATRIDGTLWCWGSNDNGALADGTGWRPHYVHVP